MKMYDIITKVKRGEPLTKDEIKDFISGYTRGDIPDYQVSAWLMAVCLKGLTDEECAYLTEAIAASGRMLDLSSFGDMSVDKHSTGGVGDKVTLVAAPLAAALGLKVAKMSGRGLGHTGGTVDKLESIPGFKATLSEYEFINQVREHGIAVIGQSEGLAPADKKLYALRDVTATVDSIPLITSSIMGKKLASGTKTILLDVKYGSGAFMKTPEDAELLAHSMVDIGRRCGRNMAALISDMDTPLGYSVGNSLEVIEAAEVLMGAGPCDLREISLKIAAILFSLAHKTDYESAEALAREALSSGAAYRKFAEWISAQGGEERYINNPKLLKVAEYSRTVCAAEDGYVISTDAERIGLCALELGAGRRTKESEIDRGAGIVLNKKRGDRVGKGETLATLYSSSTALFENAEALLLSAYKIGSREPAEIPLIYKEIY